MINEIKRGLKSRRNVPMLLLLCLLFGLSLSAGCCAELAPDFSRTPVVFVHGHGMGPGDWSNMIQHLESTGYPPEYLMAVNIRPNVMANTEAADTVISPAVEMLLARAGSLARESGNTNSVPQRVDLVSHSMGAVSSRWYAAKIAPEKVRVWISLGGANHGSNVLCSYRDEGAADLCPAFATDLDKNPVQLALNGTPESPVDETPWGLGIDAEWRHHVAPDAERHIAWYSIWIDPDSWITPAAAATLDGGGTRTPLPRKPHFRETSPGNLLLLTPAIHDDLPRDRYVIATVGMLLGQTYATEF